MKKGSLICLIVFSALIFLGLVLTIVAAILANQYTMDPWGNRYNSYDHIVYILMSLSIYANLVSTIGTFVCGIIVTVKAGKLSTSKGLTRASGITSIATGAVATILTSFTYPTNGATAIVAGIMICVSFGLALGSFLKIKKAEGFKEVNQEQVVKSK